MDDAENAEEVNVESFDLKDYENVLNEEKWCVCCIQIAVKAITRSLDFPWDPLYSWESKAGKQCHPQNAFCINSTPFLAR